VLQDSVIQHNFSQKGVILHACMHGRRKEVFQGGPLVDFSKRFSTGAKSCEICFLPLEIKKTAFFAEISNSCPTRHPYACVQETFVPHH